MAIQNISGTAISYIPNEQGPPPAARSEFKNLTDALKAGDLQGAQNAYSKIQASLKNLHGTENPQAGSEQDALKSDFDAIGKALQAGDLKSAQDAFENFGKVTQSAGRAFHRLHHGARGSNSPGGSSASAPVPPATSAPYSAKPGDHDGDKDSPGSTIDVFM
jgi:DNA-binding FadR family transcriptional regulator